MNQFLIDYILHLADNSLILGHRNSEWTGHGPILEQDIAITNISLDLIGQARYFYQYAAGLMNSASASIAVGEATEDTLAYLRDAHEFKNCLLVEQSNGDWAHTIARLFFFSAYQYYYYGELKKCKDEELSAIAERALKEVTYHLRWSSEWIIRLGDGTEESHRRMQKAVDDFWPFTEELFQPAKYEKKMENEIKAPSLESLRESWTKKIMEILTMAKINLQDNIVFKSGGKNGNHGVELNEILKDLQYIQRTYPGCDW